METSFNRVFADWLGSTSNAAKISPELENFDMVHLNIRSFNRDAAGPSYPTAAHCPSIASISDKPLSVVTHPADVTVSPLLPTSNLLSFAGCTQRTTQPESSSIPKSTLDIRFTGDPMGITSIDLAAQFTSCTKFTGLEVGTAWPTVDTPATSPLFAAKRATRTCKSPSPKSLVTDFSLRSPNLSNSLPPNDRTFSALNLLKITLSSLKIECSPKTTTPLLTACPLVHAFCKIVGDLLGTCWCQVLLFFRDTQSGRPLSLADLLRSALTEIQLG